MLREFACAGIKVNSSKSFKCNLTGLKLLNIKNTDCPVQYAIDMADGVLLRRAYAVEFCENDSDKRGLFIVDGHFLKVMREQVTMVVTITYPPFPTRC